jgi:hypothetical protein
MIMLGAVAQAQDSMADLLGRTYREKSVYAIYDFRGKDVRPDAIEGAVLDAIRLYARDASVRHGIPPSPVPEYPGQMVMADRNGRPRPFCSGESWSIGGLDTSMSKYGETTLHIACLFPYANGYRLNYISLYGQQSGAGNPNAGVLVGTFSRMLSKATGLGDASKFVVKVMDRMEEGFRSAGLTPKLVQLHPQGMEGRTVVADDLPRPSPQQAVSQPAPTQTAGVAPAVAIPANLPPEFAELQRLAMQQRDARRQSAALAAATPAGQGPKTTSAADARKELTAMGLQYFSHDQLVAAIRRGDRLAVELFVAGGGVDLAARDAAGNTPLKIAETAGRTDFADLLRAAGAK